jgi:hypothetical protein
LTDGSLTNAFSASSAINLLRKDKLVTICIRILLILKKLNQLVCPQLLRGSQ